ncbi:hypothetical protein [Clostridium estertheticum]|uniref:hypothetical protein n=1 Tax=Clostridium estertheticum TaxID=238834 RepID=UPI001CF29786|nr:hypothetical protein [Clostridium estertheticum]MCB2354416.1 hypothetical protein [Clostridium estertheticum]WAG42468.1 hypothetical protein LL065_07270 [Clostridium estertheticum]
METHYLELSPAKKDSTINFQTVSKEQFKNKGVIDHSIDYANESASFKRTGKHMELVKCHSDYLLIKITSDISLQMVSKSLAGFSRELIRVDDIREAEGKVRLFEDCVYNHAVFKSKVVIGQEKLEESAEDLSDASALKMCVDLFYGDTIKTKEQLEIKKDFGSRIKKLLITYKDVIKE